MKIYVLPTHIFTWMGCDCTEIIRTCPALDQKLGAFVSFDYLEIRIIKDTKIIKLAMFGTMIF